MKLLVWIRNYQRKKKKVLRTVSWGTQIDELVKNTLLDELEMSNKWDQCHEKQKKEKIL